MGTLLGIGDFAARSGLSPKMLRSYARAGLLVPAAVDASSGYRYYSATQLPQARVVARLRRAGIGVEAIATFFAAPHPDQLEQWERELDQQATSRRRALADARHSLERVLPGSSLCDPADKESVMTHQFAAGTATDRGGRARNEDHALVGKDLWAVADGVGGLGNGDVASRLALDVLEQGFGRDRAMAGLLDACRQANHAVWQQGAGRSPEGTMGTTLAALALTSDVGPVVVHVGDSRLYRLRNSQLVPLTKDHTVVAELLDAGQLGAEEAATHPHRRVLTRAVGVGGSPEVDHAGVSCRAGDRFLLCTDGLFQSLATEDLRAVLSSGAEPQASAEELVAAAVERGAEDNVTALVLSVS